MKEKGAVVLRPHEVEELREVRDWAANDGPTVHTVRWLLALVDRLCTESHADEVQVRRECADIVRTWAREHTGRKVFADEDGNTDYMDRYASRESLLALADRLAAA